MEKETIEKIIDAYSCRQLRVYTDMHYTQNAQAFNGYAKGILAGTDVLLLSDKKNGDGDKVSLISVDHILFIETLDS